MAGFFIAMIFGVAVFCGGILFEKYCGVSFEEIENEELPQYTDPEYLKQWEELLNYDGNRKVDEYED